MQTLLSLFRTTNHILSLSVADLTDDMARRRTRGSEGPSVTWTIGHMLECRQNVLEYLGDERPNPWSRAFGDVPATDGADYPSLATMRDEWQKMHEALEVAFATTTPATFDTPVPGTGIHGETRIGDKISFLAWHEGYHVGVIGAIRTAEGLAGPAVLARAAAAMS